MGERPDAEGLRPCPVGDGPRDELGLPADDLAGSQRVARVGGQLGLDADDPCVRSDRLDSCRDTAGEPAAADRDEDGRQVGQRLGDLEPDGALAGDDPVVVVGRDDRQAALGRDRFGDLLPLVARCPDRDDLGAVGGDPVALDRRRIGGHDDDRRDAEQLAARATPWA